MKYLIIALSFFLTGCLSDDDESNWDEADATTTTTSSVSVAISGSTNLVMVQSSSVSSSPGLRSPSLAAASSDCLTVGDVGSGTVKSVVTANNVTPCFKTLEKVDNSGGYAVWSEDTSNDTEKCGIINANGAVWEVSKCPKANGGFKNNKALKRVSTNIMRGISKGGDYIEYDQSTDTVAVLIDETAEIDVVQELQHTNKKSYFYKTGSTVKQMVDSISSIVPELGDKEFHVIGDKLQVLSGGQFTRGYFDGDGNVTQYPTGTAYYASSPVPTAYAAYLLSGGSQPAKPTYNGSLNNCDSHAIGDWTVMNCNSTIMKYSDATPDLDEVSLCAMGNCGSNTESVGCSTAGHYFYFTPFRDTFGDVSDYRLTRMDFINETYSHIFNINDPSSDMSAEQQANYHISSIACGSDTVTAKTATRTILINSADSTPDVNYLDIAIEAVIGE